MQLSYSKYPANFVAYDILYYKDHETIDLPLIERKKILSSVVSESNSISVSRYIEEDGITLFELAKAQRLEGVVGKKKNSLYWYGKRTKEWKKIKFMADYEAIAIAYILKPNNMTSLVLAKYDSNNQLVITNHVTLGVSLDKLRSQGLKVTQCPFTTIPSGHENAVWIEPMVVTVEYMPSEKEGLRQAVFKGVRDDKIPEECKL